LLSGVRFTSGKANVVEVLAFVPAMRVFSGSALDRCFGLASIYYTFDGNACYVLFQTVSGLRLGCRFRFRVYI